MLIGIIVQVNDLNPPVVESAPLVERHGFDSLWIGEHTHMPVATRHPDRRRYIDGRYQRRGWTEGGVPDFYRRFMDPYIALTAAAAVTRTLRLGTCIALPAEHNPIILAKEIATLDFISGGRLELGFGYGWNRLEARNNGLPFEQRRAVLREKVLAMEAIWENDVASFDGELVSFDDLWSWPKPVQSPRPPIRLGSASTDQTFADIVEFCDGWVPVDGHVGDGLVPAIAQLRRRADAVGRDPDSLTVDLVHTPTRMVRGCTVDEFVDDLPSVRALESYRQAGVHRLLLSPPADTLDVLGEGLERIVDRFSSDLVPG